LCDVSADPPQPHNAECFAVKHTCHRRWPTPGFDLPVSEGDLPHDGNHQPEGKLRSTSAKPSGGLGNDDLTVLGSSQVDVIGVISGLRDDAKIREVLQKLSRDAGSLPVGHKRIEAPEYCGIAERTGEYLHLGAFAQAVDTGRAFIGTVDIIKY